MRWVRPGARAAPRRRVALLRAADGDRKQRLAQQPVTGYVSGAMFNALRILVLTATMVAASGIVTAYTSAAGSAERAGDDGCNEQDCPPGAICSTCTAGHATAPSPAVVVEHRHHDGAIGRPFVGSSTLPPSPSSSDIFHPPRTRR